jgi:general secretion pathway protein M
MTWDMHEATHWWQARTGRERALLSLFVIVVLGLAAWYGVAFPLKRAAERADMHRARAAALLSEVETSGAAIGRMDVPTDASLDDVLMLSATEAGFTLETHTAQNARETAVQGHASDPTALFAWIEMLRRNHGVTVANLTVAREQDGALRAEAVLLRGGS